jgi:hypothetical protein
MNPDEKIPPPNGWLDGVIDSSGRAFRHNMRLRCWLSTKKEITHIDVVLNGITPALSFTRRLCNHVESSTKALQRREDVRIKSGGKGKISSDSNVWTF